MNRNNNLPLEVATFVGLMDKTRMSFQELAERSGSNINPYIATKAYKEGEARPRDLSLMIDALRKFESERQILSSKKRPVSVLSVFASADEGDEAMASERSSSSLDTVMTVAHGLGLHTKLVGGVLVVSLKA